MGRLLESHHRSNQCNAGDEQRNHCKEQHLRKTVVFPALSRPNIRMRTSLGPNRF